MTFPPEPRGIGFGAGEAGLEGGPSSMQGAVRIYLALGLRSE